jgi:5-methylcytosine-specific restriction endonuclease McrA
MKSIGTSEPQWDGDLVTWSTLPALRGAAACHIRARQHGGTDDPTNLALACPDCNAHKGPNLVGVDPASGETARLFNPRVDRWPVCTSPYPEPALRDLLPSVAPQCD